MNYTYLNGLAGASITITPHVRDDQMFYIRDGNLIAVSLHTAAKMAHPTDLLAQLRYILNWHIQRAIGRFDSRHPYARGRT